MEFKNTMNCDKSMKMCATCMYWGGQREFNGLGMYTIDLNNQYGTCNQVGWKGFSGTQVSANMQCPDYEAQHR